MTINSRQLEVRVEADERCTRLFLKGELDVATAPEVLGHLQHAATERVPEVVVDVSELVYVDSTGLSLFVTEHKRALVDGTTFVLSCPTPEIKRLLAVTGLTGYLTIHFPQEEGA